MKHFIKILLLAITLGLGFTSCTVESITDENNPPTLVKTDTTKKNLDNPDEPN